MNKRLLLYLYDRSGLGAYMPVDLKGHELQVEEHMEKFAEAIVKECINCIENTDKGYIFTAKDAGIVNAAHTRSMKKVKEHFGICIGGIE